jgi:type I restriction enzyme S subunit
MAVQGKLVPQDPDDEPASVLLERIRTERERLIKEGKIKRDKNESVIYKRDNSHYEKLGDIERCIDDELPFEVPESWAWVHVGDIFLHNTGKAMNSSAKQNDSSGQIRPFITTSNVYWNSFDFSNVKEMFFTTEEYKRCSAIKNDILICEGGAYYGRTAIWKYDYDICFQNHVHRLRSFLPLVPEFFYYIVLSQPVRLYTTKDSGCCACAHGLS